MILARLLARLVCFRWNGGHEQPIGVCLVCACLLALWSCATEPEKVITATSTANTSPPPTAAPKKNPGDYPSMNGPMGGQPR